LAVWSENQETLGVITHTDGAAGLLLASLREGARAPVIDNLPKWGRCRGTRLPLGVEPDSMTWTVQIRGNSRESAVRATARFWATASRCVSHGVREAELEALVKEMAERG
jgi:hypothetical protein